MPMVRHPNHERGGKPMRVISRRASRSSSERPSEGSPLPPGSTASTMRVEPVAQDPLRVHADGEHVRDRHGRTDDVGHDAVPDAGRVLDRPDGAEAAAAPAVGVPVGPVRAVHLGRHHPGVLGGGGVGPVGGDGRVVGAVPAEDAAPVGLEEVGAAVEREADLVLLAGALVLGQVLAVGHRRDVLEEAALVRRLGRQVDGEPRLGIPESPVHVAMAHRSRRATRRRRRRAG